jgi:uncharacterized protein
MPRPSLFSTDVLQEKIMVRYKRHCLILCIVFITFIFCIGAGCSGTEKKEEIKITPAWNISEDGLVKFTFPPAIVKNKTTEQNENLTKEDLILTGFSGDVHAVLVTPPKPEVILIWAPGANNAASNVSEYLKEYASRNIAVCVLDIRGNGGGGLTPGYPMNIQKDLNLYLNGEWPEFYLIAGDLMRLEGYLTERFPSVPIWISGESNGGRYAALAASADQNITGYIGISTSGFGKMGEQYETPVKDFLISIDPDITVPSINPRPVILFHAPADPIIPYKEGQALAKAAGQNVKFISFNGTHGVNREVDQEIFQIVKQ